MPKTANLKLDLRQRQSKAANTMGTSGERTYAESSNAAEAEGIAAAVGVVFAVAEKAFALLHRVTMKVM